MYIIQTVPDTITETTDLKVMNPFFFNSDQCEEFICKNR